MVERPIVDQGPQHRQQFSFTPGRICRKRFAARALGVSRTLTTTIVIVPCACLPFGVNVYFGQMAGGIDRVGSPVNQQVRMVLHLAQRARDLAASCVTLWLM